MSPPPCITCTTIVWGLGRWTFNCGDGGCGTRVGNPAGNVGVITIKMMISTNSTSINGTMLGSETGPPLLPPTEIPMIRTPFECAGYSEQLTTAALAMLYLLWSF